MADIYTQFAVPMAFARHPDPAALNADLRALFLSREKEGARHANPNLYTARNQALFESNFDLFKWPEPCIAGIREFCYGELLRTIAELNGYAPEFMRNIRIGSDAWFHVTRDGGLFGLHNHPMASWSGVYCVSAGAPVPDGPDDNGALSFLNPFVMTTMFIDAGNASLRAPYTQASRNYQLEPGQLVLFPSWLLHEVKPFHGAGERITIAFNCWFHVAKGP